MKKKPIIALVYDFDKTLCTRNMQEYGFLPSINMTADDFWRHSNEMAKIHQMDDILASMLQMTQRAKSGNLDLTRNSMRALGANIEYFPGVSEWFSRINDYASLFGVKTEHYIISSGIKTILDGTTIAGHFSAIFASDFVYSESGEPVWPSVAINYSSKTQFLYRIHKGIIDDISENTRLNRRQSKDDEHVPFSNMVYIGDGLTDVPSLKLTRMNGGYAIGVYQNEDENSYLVNDDRVSFYVPANYCENSMMDTVVKAIVRRAAAEADLVSLGWNK